MSDYISISSGKSDSGILLNAYDSMTILDGGAVNNTIVDGGSDSSMGIVLVSGGGANDTAINSGGRMYISSSGTAPQIMKQGGTAEEEAGAVVTFADNTLSELILPAINPEVHSGTTAIDIDLNDLGNLQVNSGGIVRYASVSAKGNLVATQSTSTTTTLNTGSESNASSDGLWNNREITSGGFNVSSGTTANSITVKKNGYMQVYSGGVANNVKIKSGGYITIYSDGVVSNFVLSGVEKPGYTIPGGRLYSGGTTCNTTIDVFLFQADGGIMYNTTIHSKGALWVDSGGIVSNTILYGSWDCGNNGLHISRTATAYDTIVDRDGIFYLYGEGIGVEVRSKGTLWAYTGCKMTGQMVFLEGGEVAVGSGAVFDFDISGLDPDAPVRVNNISRVRGTPIYTLTVSETQADGVYSLAYGAGSFKSTITVMSDTGENLGKLTVGKTVTINGDKYTLNRNSGKLTLSVNVEPTETTDSVESNVIISGNDVLIAHALPEAEYMYGCTPTAVGMILGYYDLYGYGDKEFANMIDGDVDLKSRGTDGNAYDMDAFDTVLGRAIASEEYVNRFHSRSGKATTPAQELVYAFKDDGKTLNTEVWNCIADYLGTGQFWRGNDNLSTTTTLGSLEAVYRYNYEVTLKKGSESHTIKGYEQTMLYGLDLYVQSRGYRLDTVNTGTYAVDVNGGDFTFSDYMKEIDAGRPVLISIKDHSMVGYGYNADTMEIIFDDCYKSGQRMAWDGAYNYSGAKRKLENITVIMLEESSGDPGPKRTAVQADITEPTNQDVLVSAVFGNSATIREYSLDGETWYVYSEPVRITDNSTVYFRGTDDEGNVSAVTSYTVENIDRSLPDKPVASADITTPTQSNVIVSAAFSEDAVVREYSLDGTNWNNYSDPITFTGNGTAFFRCANAEGKQSGITRYDVTNIDRTAPAQPVASADITAPTNRNVLVSAEFSEDAVIQEYSFDGQTWLDYEAEIVFTDNGVVHFRGTDAAGNVSGVASYKVTNIDRIPPKQPTASASITARTSGDVTVKAKFSKDTDTKEYSFNGETWSVYSKAVKFVENGTVYFRGKDAAGNYSEITRFDVTNIDKSMLDNGLNDYVYDKKKSPKRNSDSNLVAVTLKSGVSEIQFDKKTVQHETMHNFVGIGDETDFVKITLNTASKLIFSIAATDAVKFTVWKLTEERDKKGSVKYSQKSLQETSLKKVKGGTDYAALTKGLLLEAGQYYISAKSTNKENGFAFYNVELSDSSVFFTKGDNSDDWTDMQTAGGSSKLFSSIGTITSATGKNLADGWVGFGDATDFFRFRLNSAANLSFDLEATDAAKFTVWKLNSNTNKKGVVTYSLKSMQATELKADSPKTTSGVLLEAGDYYISMQSSNAKKGGSADYKVALGECTFYTKGKKNDDWTDMKTAGSSSKLVVGVGTITSASAEILADWVGFGDAVDYRKFTLNVAAEMSFTVTSTDKVTFTIWKLNSKTSKKGVTTYSLKSLQSAAVKMPKTGENAVMTTKSLALEAGTYYFSVESANAKKGGPGADYSVSMNQDGCLFASSGGNKDALAMPENSSLTGDLSFGRYETYAFDGNALADAAGLDENQTSWRNLLA